MLDYVMASPFLKKKLSLLKILSLEGSALLQLGVKVPLYPENNKVLAQGDLTLENNKATVNHELAHFAIEDLTGQLMFDQTGVTNSSLAARAFGYPLSINILSMQEPIPATTITFGGKCTVDSLKKPIQITFAVFD